MEPASSSGALPSGGRPSVLASRLRRAATLAVLVAACPQTSFTLRPIGGSAVPGARPRISRTPRAAKKNFKFWKSPAYPRPEPPAFPPGMDDPLPWPEYTAEIMIDAHSVIPWYWKETAKIEEDLTLEHDKFALWPARIVRACQALVPRFGIERPPSPWRPIIAVFDLPNPGDQWNGKQIIQYRRLARKGPRFHENVTLAWSQTYVDTSASENYRGDREIMYMLEMLSRPYPRRQILVTQDRMLARQADSMCHVRSAKWFNEELKKSGEAGVNASEALLSIDIDFEPFMYELPRAVRMAFTTR